MAQCSSVGKRFVARLLFWCKLSTRKFLNSLGGKQHFSELRVIIKKKNGKSRVSLFFKIPGSPRWLCVWVARKRTRPLDVIRSIKFALLNVIFMVGWVFFALLLFAYTHQIHSQTAARKLTASTICILTMLLNILLFPLLLVQAPSLEAKVSS